MNMHQEKVVNQSTDNTGRRLSLSVSSNNGSEMGLYTVSFTHNFL